MLRQHDLTATADAPPPPLSLTRRLPHSSRESNHERFHRHLEAHPEIYRRMVEMCFELKAAGVERYGINALSEVVRWEFARRREGERFAMPNDIRPHYSRFIMEQHPELEGFFETRPMWVP